MKRLSNKSRKELKHKMAKVFSCEIDVLPSGLQEILLDDLVTAFENRLDVLSQAQPNINCFVAFEASYQKIQA